MQQLELPGGEVEGKSRLQEGLEGRFHRFHRENPQVYAMLVELARKLKRCGWKRCSMKMLFEQCRAAYALETNGKPYKLDNSMTALYSRLIHDLEPDLRGFFELRQRRAGG